MPAFLETILDTHPDMICRYDADLTMTYANESAASFFHTTKQDVIGTNLIDHVPEEQKAGVWGRLAGLSPDNPTSTQLHRLTRRAEPVFILWTNIGLFDGETLTGFQSVGRTVTKEVLLQREVEAKSAMLDSVQQELRAVLDHVPSRIWYKDDKNMILRLNTAAAESMGMAVADVEGQNTYDLFGDAAKAYHDDDLEVIRSGQPKLGIEEAYTPDDGEQGWVRTDKIPLSDTGSDEPRILVVSTDITALKEQEALLKTINKNLDDFAAMTSHDLQAPLRKIGISAELMELEFGHDLPDGMLEYLQDIGKGVEHMRQLIRSFLRFMRESPSGVDLATIDLDTLLLELAEEERPSIEESGGSLTIADLPSMPAAGDLPLLRQVFSNIIQNAVKYRAYERPLQIEISAQSDHQFWVVDIKDNGIGIDPAHYDKVFDLFSRAKPTGSVTGSGIGLALCRRIVTLHGGSIELVPVDENGSCFRVKLCRRRKSG